MYAELHLICASGCMKEILHVGFISHKIITSYTRKPITCTPYVCFKDQ